VTLNRCITIGLLLLLVASIGSAADTAHKVDDSQRERWQQLRQLQGHFDGGQWNDLVDRWQGEKHRLMQQMAQALNSHGASRDDIQKTFGAPDTILEQPVGQSSDSYQRTMSATQWQGEPSGELWLYHWRCQHDQLVLAVENDQLVAIGWLLAFE
jgi:hypothetical protein